MAHKFIPNGVMAHEFIPNGVMAQSVHWLYLLVNSFVTCCLTGSSFHQEIRARLRKRSELWSMGVFGNGHSHVDGRHYLTLFTKSTLQALLSVLSSSL